MLAANTIAQLSTPPKMLLASNKHGALLMENGKIIKRYPTRGGCQDAWMIEDGSVLVTEQIGVTKFDKAQVLTRVCIP